MKNLLFLFFMGVIVLFLFFPKQSTKDVYNLSEVEYKNYLKQARKGNLKSIEKLYLYYHYSINDYNKSIDILRQGSKLGDKIFQYRLALYFIRSYYPNNQKEKELCKNEGIYWLQQSAKSGYQEAINELNSSFSNKMILLNEQECLNKLMNLKPLH